MELAPPRASTQKPMSGGTAMELPQEKLFLIIFNTSAVIMERSLLYCISIVIKVSIEVMN
jgi:hypothetical protein